MQIAFYAPMKPPGHPVPSGDRRMARALMAALRRGGHKVTLASRLRSWDSGNPQRQRRIRRAGERIATKLTSRWRAQNAPARPDLWFTYHLYHKAPDWIGPSVCKALSIPYAAAEASFANKQKCGPWAEALESTRLALNSADAVFALSKVDEGGLVPHVAPDHLHRLPPFIETGPYLNPTGASPPELTGQDQPLLLAVGMMRHGDKLASYKVLGEALRQIDHKPWTLVVIGDGPAKAEVQEALLPGRTLYLGALEAPKVAATMAACDIMVWPAINEAYGMALLEAQAAGLPVIAGECGGVPEIVLDQKTGLITKLGDPTAFAKAMVSLIDDQARRKAMADQAQQNAIAHHDLTVAAETLDSVLSPLVAGS